VIRYAKIALFQPATVTLLAMSLLVAVVILGAKGDPLALARIGTRFSQGDAQGTEGYDGQFVYYIARDPRPAVVAPMLDSPAYRYQRILLPLLARALALGRSNWLPWVLAILGVLAQTMGTWAVSVLLKGWGVSPWYALVYGSWVGFGLAVRLDLPEPLAYALVAGAILAGDRGHSYLGSFLYGLALFTREVTILFVLAQVLVYLAGRKWRDALVFSTFTLVPFGIFQIWLWATFGQTGLNSGGAMATPFEWIPFMGLLRIGLYSSLYLVAMLLVFGPSIILPSLWGLWSAATNWLKGERNVIVLGLFFNALAIPFLPFSTFRETGGVLRFACGLVLAGLLFAGRYRLQRQLNYTFLWIVLNVFLLKS
jgi:hypothetical protein